MVHAEYLPQIAAYVEAILTLAIRTSVCCLSRPPRHCRLYLAILNDDGTVRVLGEAKRSTPALSSLRQGAVNRFGKGTPTNESRRHGDEQRQLAWRLWTVSPEFTWLIGPGHREAFRTELAPLRLSSLPMLPPAHELDLAHRPPQQLAPPVLA